MYYQLDDDDGGHEYAAWEDWSEVARFCRDNQHLSDLNCKGITFLNSILHYPKGQHLTMAQEMYLFSVIEPKIADAVRRRDRRRKKREAKEWNPLEIAAFQKKYLTTTTINPIMRLHVQKFSAVHWRILELIVERFGRASPDPAYRTQAIELIAHGLVVSTQAPDHILSLTPKGRELMRLGDDSQKAAA